VCILIVDDEPDARDMMSTFLSLSGYETATATNGKEALAQALAGPPAVILLDIEMPVMSGVGFRQNQLQEPTIADVPVVCISGRHNAHAIAEQLGVAACLTKPIALDRLLDILHRLTAGTSHCAHSRAR